VGENQLKAAEWELEAPVEKQDAGHRTRGGDSFDDGSVSDALCGCLDLHAVMRERIE
jgi:hypothetical protein